MNLRSPPNRTLDRTKAHICQYSGSLTMPSVITAMGVYLLFTLCLLGSSSSQKVTELRSCITKENNLLMDCKYEVSSTQNTICEYKDGPKAMGGTSPTIQPDSTYKNRANITIRAGNVCRLVLIGFPDDKPKNYTCVIMQQMTAEKSLEVEKKKLLTCSALSVLYQSGPPVLLTLVLLPVLLGLMQK